MGDWRDRIYATGISTTPNHPAETGKLFSNYREEAEKNYKCNDRTAKDGSKCKKDYKTDDNSDFLALSIKKLRKRIILA
jgi:hypothetical protein